MKLFENNDFDFKELKGYFVQVNSLIERNVVIPAPHAVVILFFHKLFVL